MIDAVNESGVSARIRIDAVELDPKDPSRETYLYSVSVENTDVSEGADEKRWVPFCEPDSENVNKAIPLSGFWNDEGHFIDSPVKLTLACTSGVIAKCVRWGYKPWKSESFRDLHRACVRMARADYCGNGHGHTKDGTLIDLFDAKGIQIREQGTMELEAAWSPNGATYLNRPRWGTLDSIIAECPEKLRGRTARDLPGLSIHDISARWPETLLFNDSYSTPRIGDPGHVTSELIPSRR